MLQLLALFALAGSTSGAPPAPPNSGAAAVSVQLNPGPTELSGEALSAALEAVLHRPIALAESLPDAGPGLRVTGQNLTAVEVVYLPAGGGTPRQRVLTVSPVAERAAREIALLAAELTTDERPPVPPLLEVEGAVRDQAGEPIAEARLTLRAESGAVESTDTDQRGRFRLPDLSPGHYQLQVEGPDSAPATFPLTLTQSLRGLSLPLQRQPPPKAGPVEIEGQVHGPDGEPLAEAQIVLLGPKAVAIDSTDTDLAGRFRFPSVPLGPAVLGVESVGYAPLRHPVQVEGPIGNLDLQLAPLGGASYRTVVQSTRAPLPTQDGSSTTVIRREDVHDLPGGTSLPLNTVLETQAGFSPDNYGAVHVRGNFAGLQLRVDGIQLPPAIQNRLEQLLEPQIVDHTNVIVGGLPAEYGEDVAGVLDVYTRRATGPFSGDGQVTYGTHENVLLQANGAGDLGPINTVLAGSFHATDRGLDPPAAEPILHDQLHEGRVFLRLEDKLSAAERVELLAVYAESHYQIPLDPTVLPLSDGPANAMRGVDPYGNSPPDFVPSNSNPTELERELFAAASYFHKFNDRAELQIAPFGRLQQSQLGCDTAHQLGPTADPGQQCSNVDHQVVQGGLQVNQTLGLGTHDLKAGLLIDDQRSAVVHTQFFRNDANPFGGLDPTQTVGGEDDIDSLLAGVYLQDKIHFGKLTLFPGVRLDFLRASLQAPSVSTALWGPSARLGAAYAFTDEWVLHAYVGTLWQPPGFDAPAAARLLGLVPANAPVPFDLTAEQDYYSEIGIAARLLPQLTVSAVGWGRLSRHTLDDNEVGDTALTADYNYQRGRAAGGELWAKLALGKNLHAFGNLTAMVAQGEGIATSRYLFTSAQLSFQGYQAVDNAQTLAGNLGFDLADDQAETHLSGLMVAGSGLRTGPTNNATLPANCVVNATLRHAFVDFPLKPEVALDVYNLFNVIYAYRISTGSLAGTSYAPLRELMVRLTVPFGS